jgi:predicted lipid-binding transport protein (Tim44 family)
MTRRVQIVLAKNPSAQDAQGTVRPGWLHRAKHLFGGLLLAAVAIGILILAVFLGSILAAGILIILVIAVAAFILKSTMLQGRK